MSLSGNHDVPLPANFKTKTDMEVISIERSTYEVIGLPLRLSKNCWRASIASSQRWRRWPVEAMTKGWAIGLTTKTCVKCWTSVQEHYRLYGIMGRWPILKSTARCTISMRMWLWEDTWNVWERKAGSSRVRRSAWWNDGDNKAWKFMAIQTKSGDVGNGKDVVDKLSERQFVI